MKIKALIENFRNDEAGAVTVDWVVLTAAIVGLGLAVVASVRTGANSVASQIQTSLSSASVVSLGTLN
jgi:Flp pilus assembly pilin Flp